MQTADNNKIPITVELQDNFSYLPIGVIIIILMAVAALVYLIIKIVKKAKSNEPKPIQVVEIKEDKLMRLKHKYHNMLMGILKRHEAGQITDRLAYQELSKVIRHFVYDVTGIKVQNYTLEEIGGANIPSLYYLIAECYAPEFDAIGSGNVPDIINKAGRVIEGWN